MATTSDVKVTPGTGKNVATYSFTEDTETKETQRVALNESDGTDTAVAAKLGSLTETAPTTDTASSGLNGRLQRIAQRLTSLIALLPSSIGQKATTGSLSVTLSSDHAGVPVNQNTLPWTIQSGSAAADFAKAEDAASANADVGVPAMAIQKATPADTAGTDGDYAMLQMSGGRLWSTANIDKVAGTAIDTNSGVKSGGTVRVVLATDQPQLTNKLLVTPDANSAVNVAQINGVTALMGNGATGTGSQRVTIASDNTVLPGVGAGATGSAVPANASYSGAIAKTSLPTAATDANLVGAMSDKFGRQVVLPGTIRDLVATQTTTISSSTSETTVVTAGSAGIFNDLILLVVSNTSATAARMDFRDTTAGSILFSIYIPAGDTRGFSLGGTPIPQTTAATNWTAQSSASVADLRVYAVFHKNK